MQNAPVIKLGLTATSRDCFPKSLSVSRRDRLALALAENRTDIYTAQTVIESETDVACAIRELKDNGVNALVLFLGNFGPEGPEGLVVKNFDGPVMLIGAAETNPNNLTNERGDAFCGMLNASYNLGLRNLKAYIPSYPIGDEFYLAGLIKEFIPIARVVIGVRNLKIISFGPRPQDFLACNAPIAPLSYLGAEIQENSELDLLAAFNDHANDPRIPGLMAEMEQSLGTGNRHPGILPVLAQYEITLLDWMKKNKGLSPYVAFANKCWPAFQTQFKFVPCYVNSRLSSMGVPVACETDIYGALSQFMLGLATDLPATLLDINNTVPAKMSQANAHIVGDYQPTDLFMGFHCGNTPACHLKSATLAHQLIMKRALEPDSEPNITRGTLEGQLKPGNVTLFRLQSNPQGQLLSYIAEGESLDIDPCSFGGIGVLAIKEMGRFYRHVLIEKRFPHHGALGFDHAGKTLFEALKLLGVCDINYNRPKGLPYPTENPFN